MIQFCIILLLFISSLNDEFFEIKTLKTNFILFLFEIMLACSSSSLRTLSGTNRCYAIQDVFWEAIDAIIWDAFVEANWDVNWDANCDANQDAYWDINWDTNYSPK